MTNLSHVGGRVDTTFGVLTVERLEVLWGLACERYVRQSNFEALLDILEDLLIILVADEGDGQTLGTETTSTTDTVEIGVGISGQIVVNGKVDTLDIDTTAEDVSSDTNTLVELLELLVTFDTRHSVSNVYVLTLRNKTYRSSWLTPECTAILEKLHSRSSLSNSLARRVLFTKMMTWLNSRLSKSSFNLRFFSCSLSLM